MKVSRAQLQTYFADTLPSSEKLVELLTFHSFEIEGIAHVDGDDIIDVDVLANRSGDCLCHLGIARELSVILSIPLVKDPLRQPHPQPLPATDRVRVAVESPSLCDSYRIALLEGVSVGPSPEWLRQYLTRLGQKSINNVVDATNYVMYELGQPLHAFDADKLGKDEQGEYNIAVQSAKDGESIITLTGDTYTLNKDTLLIYDAVTSTPIGIAGIKGGKHAEVDTNTKTILVEAGHFNYASIRATSQRLKLATDASVRFQNQPPIELTAIALREVVSLIIDIASGTLVGEAIQEVPLPAPYKVGVSLREIHALLGTSYTKEEVVALLTRAQLPFEVIAPRQHICAHAPTLLGKAYKLGARIRYDAPETFDCSSLTAYVYAMSGVAIPRMSVDQYVFGTEVADPQPGDLVFANTGVGTIHYESIEYKKGTKVPVGVDHVGIYMGDGMVLHATGGSGVVSEPLQTSERFTTIVGYRSMLGLGTEDERFVITVPAERRDIRIREDVIEEIGRIAGYRAIASATLPPFDGPVVPHPHHYITHRLRAAFVARGWNEVITSTLLDTGAVELKNALASDKSHLRESLHETLALTAKKNLPHAPLWGGSDIMIFEIGIVFSKEGERLHVAYAAETTQKKREATLRTMLEEGAESIQEVIGDIAAVHQSGNVVEYDITDVSIPEDVAYDFLKETDDVRYQPISQYPFALRDIALWVPNEVSSFEIEDIIRTQAGALLARIDLFDQFEKDGKVSYAYRLVFLSQTKTLTDSEILERMTAITNTLTSLGYTVR